MNILILANSVVGLHSFRKEVVKAIVDAGYTVYVAFPDKDERAEYFNSIGCRYIDIPFERRGINPLKDVLLLLNYWKSIKKIKPVAVLTYTIKPNVYGGLASAISGVPLIANITGLGDSLENPGLLQKLTMALYKLGLRKANTVFFQNSSNKEFCIKNGLVRAEQTQLLPGSGVNLHHHIYQEYPSDGKVKFLYIARLLKDKGVDEYFEAARVIRERHPETEFQILGPCEGKYKKDLEELCNKGVVKYLGTTSDVRPFIGNAHCCIMPSYHEGLSNVNLESAANGRPVITTDVPGCRETVDNSVTGILCQARSADSLIEAVEKFIQLPYEQTIKMGINGRKKMEREYNSQLIIDAYDSRISML